MLHKKLFCNTLSIIIIQLTFDLSNDTDFSRGTLAGLKQYRPVSTSYIMSSTTYVHNDDDNGYLHLVDCNTGIIIIVIGFLKGGKVQNSDLSY